MNLFKFEMITVNGVCDEHGEWECGAFVGKEKYASCPKCSEIQREKENSEFLKNQAEANRKRLLEHCGIPGRYTNKRLADYETDEKNAKVADLCNRYASNIEKAIDRGVSLCFCGKPGTGKTHLAIGIIHSALIAGRQSKYTTAVEMLREVKSTYRKNSEMSEIEVIKKYSRIELLVLDEVGMQLGSDTEKLILSEIINNRYGNVLPTILISNLGITELREYLGDRIIDRMREGGGAVISFDWDSKRGEL